MLTKIATVWGAKSIEGFAVIRRGSPMTQFEIEYSAGSQSLLYSLENLAPGSMQFIFSEQIGPWLPPHAHKRIDSVEQKQIANRIVQAMHFLGDRDFVVA